MQNNYSQKAGAGEILKSAFSYWNKTLFYNLVFSLLYFSLFFMGYFYLFRYFGYWEQILPYGDLARTDFSAFNKKMEEVIRQPDFSYFVLGIFILSALLNPLNVGLYKMYRKIDLKEKIEMNDIFAGYLGFGFFKFFGFYLFWIIVFSYANSTLLLGIVWIFVTLFSVPLLFFRNTTTFEGIALSSKILWKNLTTIFLCVLFAAAFSFSGIVLFGFGFLLTFPFWNAVVYSLYSRFYSEHNNHKVTKN